MKDKPHENFTNNEAAEFLRTSIVTLWRERKALRIIFRRIGSKILYTWKDLEDYLERNKKNHFNKN